MARQKALTREQVVDRAYALACEQGLSGVSIRSIAAECGVAMGTIYNYFPTKADLLAGVVGRFWREELGGEMHEAIEPGADYVAFCRRFFADVADALARFRRDWLPQLVAASGMSMADCPEAVHVLDHMRAGLVRVLEGDPRIDRARLSGDLAPERVAELTLATVMELAAGLGAPGSPTSADADAEANAGSLGDPSADARGRDASQAISATPGESSAASSASSLFDAFCRLLRLALYASAGTPRLDAHAAEPIVRTELKEKFGS